MTDEPYYGPFTEEIWTRMPEFYRTYDADNDWQFKKYLSSCAGAGDDAMTLFNRFYFDTPDDNLGPTTQQCDLADPNNCDAAWIPWLAQMLGISLKGVYVPGGTTEQTIAAQRMYLSNLQTGYLSGSRTALAYAARLALTDSQYVAVADHTTDSSDFGAATQWDVCIVYQSGEEIDDVVDTIVRVGAKPAGVNLWSRTYDLTWATFESNYPTWAAVNGKSWAQVQNTGI